MHVTLRRKGLTLNAVWDGLAKPSDKTVNYWLRAKPTLAQTNATFTAADILGIFKPAIQSTHSVSIGTQAGGSMLSVLAGSWGQYRVTTELTSLFATQADLTQSPWITGHMTDLDVQASARVRIEPTVNTTVSLAIALFDVVTALPKRIDQEALTLDYSVNTQFTCELSIPYINLFTTSKNAILAEETAMALTLPSEHVVLLDAPLPDHSLFTAQDPSSLLFLPETPIDHMTSVSPDVIVTSQGGRRVRSTHAATGSQTPNHTPEILREVPADMSLHTDSRLYLSNTADTIGVSSTSGSLDRALNKMLLVRTSGTQYSLSQWQSSYNYDIGSTSNVSAHWYFREGIPLTYWRCYTGYNSSYYPRYLRLYAYHKNRMVFNQTLDPTDHYPRAYLDGVLVDHIYVYVGRAGTNYRSRRAICKNFYASYKS